MLPGHARMRRSEDFRRTVRHGVRAGRRTVVVHALRVDPTDTTPPARGRGDSAAPAVAGAQHDQVGFVVSKAVGSAVRRNRVRRRLRHLALAHLRGDAGLPGGTLVVVRALPPAATAGVELGVDLDAAWSAALTRLARR